MLFELLTLYDLIDLEYLIIHLLIYEPLISPLARNNDKSFELFSV